MDPFIDLVNGANSEKAVAVPRLKELTLTQKYNGKINIPAYTLQKPDQSSIPLSRDLQTELPPVNELPQDVRDFLKSIEKLENVDKIERVHDFTRQRIKYKDYTGLVDPAFSNFKDVLNAPDGDCDNYATLACGLLRYAAFKKEDVYWMVGKFHYTYEDGKIDSTYHTVAIIRSGNSHYVVDMNTRHPYPLDQNLQAATILSNPQNSYANANGKISFEPVSIVRIGGEPDMYIFPKENERLKKAQELAIQPFPPVSETTSEPTPQPSAKPGF